MTIAKDRVGTRRRDLPTRAALAASVNRVPQPLAVGEGDASGESLGQPDRLALDDLEQSGTGLEYPDECQAGGIRREDAPVQGELPAPATAQLFGEEREVDSVAGGEYQCVGLLLAAVGEHDAISGHLADPRSTLERPPADRGLGLRRDHRRPARL